MSASPVRLSVLAPTPTVGVDASAAAPGRGLLSVKENQPAALSTFPSSCSPLQQVLRRSSVQGVKYLYIFHCRVPFPTVVQPQMGMLNTGIGRGWSPHRY